MSLEISSGGITSNLPAENFFVNSASSASAKTPPSPPPPPPPPPPQDTVQLSLTENIHRLKSAGDNPSEISQILGVPEQTVSIYLGSSILEATLASAPTLPTPPSAG